MRLPDKRLKLPGDDRFNGIEVLFPGGDELTFYITAPLRARRPQLTRDPLGRRAAGVVGTL